MNETRFLIQSRENEFYTTNIYNFYFIEKGLGSSQSKIEIPNPDNSRQITYVFKKENFNSTETPSFTYIVFAEVTTKSGKIVTNEEVTLYTTKDILIANYNTTDTPALSPTEEIKKAIPTITPTMAASDTLSAATLISELIAAPRPITTNIGSNQNNNNNSNNVTTTTTGTTATFKPIVAANGTIVLPPPVTCNDAYCSYKGYCLVVSRNERKCKCLPKYSGNFCQISSENKQIFDNYLTQLTSTFTYQIFKSTSLPNATQVNTNGTFNSNNTISTNQPDNSNSVSIQTPDSSFFKAINTLVTTLLDVAPDSTTNIQTISITLKTSLNNYQTPEDAKKIVSNGEAILSSAENLFTTTIQLSERKKYENLESDYKSGKLNSNDINVIPIDLTKENVTDFSAQSNTASNNPENASTNNNNNQANTSTNNSNVPVQNTQTNAATSTGTATTSQQNNNANQVAPQSTTGNNNNNGKKRILQTATTNVNTNTTDNFILDVKNTDLLKLTPNQVTEFKTTYQETLDITKRVIVANFTANKPNAIEYYRSNDYFEYYATTITDLNNYNFLTYFSQRKANKLSYFDASTCLKSFVNKNNGSGKYDFSVIYYTYFYFAYPIFNFDSDLSKKSISQTHSFTFYDANITEIELKDCAENITHYLPVYPNNADFIAKLNVYPQKYYNVPQYDLGKKYMPYYIFMNGTIDNYNPTETQKNLYYKQYSINLTSYDSTNGFYSPSNNKFNYLNQEGYSISTSTGSGEFSLFAYSDPLTTMLNNTYFMNYNQIFNIGENYRGNPSWYVVILLLGSFLIGLISTIFLKNVIRKFNNYNTWNEYEQSIMIKDSGVFGDNRYEFEGYNGFDSNDFQTIKNSEKIESEVEDKNSNKNNENSIDNNLARNKLGKLKRENLNDFEEVKGEEGKIIINDVEINQGDNNYKNEERLKAMKVKEDKNKNDKFSRNDKGYAKIAGNKNYSQVNKNKRCYNIFYFIGLRNIYSNMILLSSPFSPKYKTLSKFAFFIFLQMLITVVLFVFAPFKFNVCLKLIEI